MQGVSRPVSPHLQVYRWQITMWLSSLHRITGLLLSLGALALAAWLISLASGQEAYAWLNDIAAQGWFKLPLVAWTFCFFFHLANGVRHLFWDLGAGFERRRIQATGWAVVAFTVVATLAFAWAAIF